MTNGTALIGHECNGSNGCNGCNGYDGGAWCSSHFIFSRAEALV